MLDTNVWLDLVVFRDPAASGLMQALCAGEAVVLVEPRMRDELARVLAYPALALDDAARMRVQEAAARLSHLLPTPSQASGTPRCRDPDDQMFVDLALAHRADGLLSRDDALLRMAARLRRDGIAVLPPAAWCAARRDQISKR